MPKPDQPPLFKPAPLPITALSDSERLACLRLIRSDNIGPVTFRQLINHYGGAARAIEALPEASRRGGARRVLRICSRDEAERELASAEKIGAKPVFTIEPGYPPLLAHIEAPPPMVYIKGRSDLISAPMVAIVGSRQCSAAGSEMARRFAHGLGSAGYVVVSGLARGIDKAAHVASISSGTVAVLAGGIDWIYPPEHADLQRKIAEVGLLLTERPPGFQPRDRDFPRRNRIVAGLCLGVVIIEAAARSGTLVTARYAAEFGREVFALPGHPMDPRAEGTNALLKRGATLVTDPQDAIDVFKPMVGLDEQSPMFSGHSTTESQRAASQAEHPVTTEVGDGERNAVLAALSPAPVPLDVIIRATGLAPAQVNVALLELDIAGRIERHGQSLVALRSD